MAKVKYRIREYNPTENQNGSHSFFAEAVSIQSRVTQTSARRLLHALELSPMK